jgi:hypothetical protein
MPSNVEKKITYEVASADPNKPQNKPTVKEIFDEFLVPILLTNNKNQRQDLIGMTTMIPKIILIKL